MYRDTTKTRNWLGQLEPSRPVTLVDEDEPKLQIGESILVAVKNIAPRRPGLNQPDYLPSVAFSDSQYITSDLLRDGMKNTKRYVTSRNAPNFYEVK